jgi:hypothetical protein
MRAGSQRNDELYRTSAIYLRLPCGFLWLAGCFRIFCSSGLTLATCSLCSGMCSPWRNHVIRAPYFTVLSEHPPKRSACSRRCEGRRDRAQAQWAISFGGFMHIKRREICDYGGNLLPCAYCKRTNIGPAHQHPSEVAPRERL